MALHPTDPLRLDELVRGARHQGLVAHCTGFPYTDAAALATGTSRLILAADQIQDPQNLGALVRSAAAAGAGAVIIPKDGSVGITASVEAAAAGTAALIPICRTVNLSRSLGLLKDAGFWVIGLAAAGGQDLYGLDVPERAIVVVGGERGMRPLVVRTCDLIVSVPMFGRIESLNASVAAAIVLFELQRRWRAP